jgi:serralysin
MRSHMLYTIGVIGTWTTNRHPFSLAIVRRLFHGLHLLVVAAILSSCATPNQLPTVEYCEGTIGTPYSTYKPLMTQSCEEGPLYVTGSGVVTEEALHRAGEMLTAMLEKRPDVAMVLRDEGALTGVFAVSENVCDLDYFADLEGEPICEEAAGGLGGVPGRPATGCSEKNVLGRSDDPYSRGEPNGENVCVHELAHTIMNVGLSGSERQRILERYEQVLNNTSLWRDSTGKETYALSTNGEFWAEVSQSYFNANPDVESFLHNGVNGHEELKDYDPVTFDLVHEVYGGWANLK